MSQTLLWNQFYENHYKRGDFNKTFEKISLQVTIENPKEEEFLAILPKESEFQASISEYQEHNMRYYENTRIRKLLRSYGDEYARVLININNSTISELDGHFLITSNKLLEDYIGLCLVYTPPNKTVKDIFKANQEIFIEITNQFV